MESPEWKPTIAARSAPLRPSSRARVPPRQKPIAAIASPLVVGWMRNAAKAPAARARSLSGDWRRGATSAMASAVQVARQRSVTYLGQPLRPPPHVRTRPERLGKKQDAWTGAGEGVVQVQRADHIEFVGTIRNSFGNHHATNLRRNAGLESNESGAKAAGDSPLQFVGIPPGVGGSKSKAVRSASQDTPGWELSDPFGAISRA